MTSPRRRLIAGELCDRFDVSQRRVARALDLPRSSFRSAPVPRDEQAALARRIEELVLQPQVIDSPMFLLPGLVM